MRKLLWTALLSAGVLVAGNAAAGGEDATKAAKTEARGIDGKQELQQATATMREIAGVSENGIPQELLNQSQAVIVVPGVGKASSAAGAPRGDGVMVVRGKDGSWSHPVFVELTGGSAGWQAGAAATDVVLVFRNGDAARKVLNGAFTLGADGSVAPGPVGTPAGAGMKPDSEVYSYSRSGGVLAGVSIDGSKLLVNKGANAEFYGEKYADASALVAAKELKAPSEADAFVAELSKHTMKSGG